MTEAYLFDLDGVLIDSESRYSEIWRDIESRYPTGIADFAQVIKGTTLTNILSTYFPNTQEEVKKELYERENKMLYDYCPGARELLETLKASGTPAALVTSSDEVKMSHLWAQHPEMKNYFAAVIDASKVTRSKPDPQGYLLAAQELGVDPKNCIVVEDSIQGMRAGKAAGAKVVGIAGTLPASKISNECDVMLTTLVGFKPI